MGKLPSKACWTLLFKVWVLEAETEEGPPPEDGGLEVRLIITVSDGWGWGCGYGYRNVEGPCTCVRATDRLRRRRRRRRGRTGSGSGSGNVVCARAADSDTARRSRCGFALQIMCVMSCNVG